MFPGGGDTRRFSSNNNSRGEKSNKNNQTNKQNKTIQDGSRKSFGGGNTRVNRQQGRTGQWRNRQALNTLCRRATTQSNDDCNSDFPGLSNAVAYERSSSRNLRQSWPTNKKLRQTVDKNTPEQPEDQLPRNFSGKYERYYHFRVNKTDG